MAIFLISEAGGGAIYLYLSATVLHNMSVDPDTSTTPSRLVLLLSHLSASKPTSYYP